MRKFSAWKTFIKAGQTAIAANLAIELVRLDLPTTAEEWKARGAQLAVTLTMAVGRGVWNMWKTREVPGNPFYNIATPWMVALVLIPTMTGCVSMTPALAGKTHYQMDFVDTVQAPEGEAGQNTEFHVKVSAPAGVDVTNLASMNYDWKGDGSGKIAVAGDTKADTTAQAAALVEVNAAQAQAFTGLIQALAAALPLLTGVPGGGGEAPEMESPIDLPTTLPTDLAGWLALAREHPEILQLLGGLGK